MTGRTRIVNPENKKAGLRDRPLRQQSMRRALFAPGNRRRDADQAAWLVVAYVSGDLASLAAAAIGAGELGEHREVAEGVVGLQGVVGQFVAEGVLPVVVPRIAHVEVQRELVTDGLRVV